MNRMGKNKNIGSVPGIPIRGNIIGFSPSEGVVYVTLPLTQSGTPVRVKVPAGWIGPKGQISCGYPQRGTSIFVIQGQGGEWMFVGYDFPDSRGTFDTDGTHLVSSVSKLRQGRWITAVENDIHLFTDPKDGVVSGGSTQFVQSDPIKGIHSTRFLQEMHFSEAHREVIGPVFRDLESNNTRNVAGSSLSGHSYQNSLRQVGLDPSSKPSVSRGADRNPALTEARSMYYEFVSSFNYTDDETESRIFAGEDPPRTKPYQRKRSRTDSVSLSLDHPNFLAEIIIGTVVDIYGNILDINRSKLPSGLIESMSFKESEDDRDVVFRRLREQLRKSIAYHFEINARKEPKDGDRDLAPNTFTPDYNDSDDYSRTRSRFFIDIDKEGQFKINVPSSSEVGNVPLLVRTENFSNLKGAEEEVDRGQFLRNSTSTDIFLEPHGKGVVELKSNQDKLKAFAAPLNRFEEEDKQIKLGTGFHNISEVLMLHKFEKPYAGGILDDSGGDVGTGGFPNSLINLINPVEDVVSLELIVAGPGANAGGRSGTISMDGMLSLSIGANTVDRQSLWLDTAGGIVMAVGRDRFQRSIAGTLDGDVFLQIGGPTINDDSRFPSSEFNNEARDGVIDIRIFNSGSFHTIRIDAEGMKIHSPQRIDIVSEGDMRLKSVRGNLYLDAEGIYQYPSDASTARWTVRSTEGSSGTTL